MRRPADEEGIACAARLLREGGLVAFPTETVYGLGADATDPQAVARIFDAKRRPSFDPLIVHVSDRPMLNRVVAAVPPAAETLLERFWPGPLTLVLDKTDLVPGIVTSGLDTVAVRMPAHPVALRLIEMTGSPVAAPSANRFGRLSPTRAEHVERQLDGDVDLILDGGSTRHGVESTIVDLTDGPSVLRHGAVTLEQLEAVLGEVADHSGPHDVPRAPGQLESHYAPMTTVRFVPDDGIAEDERSHAAYLGYRSAPEGFAATETLSTDGDLVTAAARLFEALHRLDERHPTVIWVEPVPEVGLGRAIMERLRRAAG